MTRKPQIKICATIAGRDGHRSVDLLIDGAVALAGLHAAILRAINIQQPHEAGRPIVAIKYDVRANALPVEKPEREMSIASHCAMTCNEGGFIRFIDEISEVDIKDANAARNFVLGYCVIESRTELNDPDGGPNARWQELRERYDAWLRC